MKAMIKQFFSSTTFGIIMPFFSPPSGKEKKRGRERLNRLFIVVTINLSSFYLDSTVGLSHSYTQHFKSPSKGMDSGKYGMQVPELCWTHWKKSQCCRNKLFHKSNSCCMLDVSRKSTVKSFLKKCNPLPYYPLYPISEVFLE